MKDIAAITATVFTKWDCTPVIKMILIAVQTALSIPTITANPITWLPVIAAAMFTGYIDTKDVMWFKWVIIITLIMWGVYDIYHQNYVSIWFRIFTIISNGISMWKIHKDRMNEKENLPA